MSDIRDYEREDTNTPPKMRKPEEAPEAVEAAPGRSTVTVRVHGSAAVDIVVEAD